MFKWPKILKPKFLGRLGFRILAAFLVVYLAVPWPALAGYVWMCTSNLPATYTSQADCQSHCPDGTCFQALSSSSSGGEWMCPRDFSTYPDQATCSQACPGVQCIKSGTYMCAADLNGNGQIDQDEFANCAYNYYCPLSGGSQCDADHKCTLLTDPKCPSGSQLNPTRDVCEAVPDISCPSGYSFDYNLDKCIHGPNCPSGGGYVSSRNRCEVPFIKSCPNGWTYVSRRNRCEKSITCPSPGSYDAVANLCATQDTVSCPSGYQYNSSRNRCERQPYCQAGIYSPARNRCEANNTQFTCPSGYTYNSSRHRCEAPPQQTTRTGSCSGSSYLSACRVDWIFKHNGSVFQTHSKTVRPGAGGFANPWMYSPYYKPCMAYVWLVSRSCKLRRVHSTSNSRVCYIDAYPYSYSYTSYSYDWWSYDQWEFTITSTPIYNTNYRCSLNGQVYSSLSQCQSACKETVRSCPNGGTYDSAHNVCYKPANITCPSGWYLDSSLNLCYQSAVCPNGGSLDGTSDVCWVSVTHNCPSGYTYNSALGRCIRTPNCSPGALDEWRDVCFTSFTPTCPSGYSYDSSLRVCYAPVQCSSGGQFDSSSGICIASADIHCPQDTAYSPTSNKCEASPACERGTYQANIDKCKLVADCQGQWDCPLPGGGTCMNMGSPDSYQDEPGADMSYYHDDGQVDQDGNCLGQLYIFNGRPMTCKPSGLKTGFQNCCDADDDTVASLGDQLSLLGGTFAVISKVPEAIKLASYTVYLFNHATVITTISGERKAIIDVGANFFARLAENSKVAVEAAISVAEAGGTAFQAATQAIVNGLGLTPQGIAVKIAINIALHIVKSFLQGCDPDDLTTAAYNELGLCHYVGKHCIKKLPLVGCVQKEKVYCCFASKLARIIHEQGRPQLKDFPGWGTPEAPACRGFTPEEFQMLDFSRIDLSEWYHDIKVRAQRQIQQNLQQNLQKFQQNIRLR